MGQDCRFLQGKKTRVEPVRKMSKELCDSEPVSVEIRNYKKSGDMFWNNITIVPVTDNNDKLEYFIGYQEDITERKKQEVQREVFQKQADNSSNMITILDDNLDIFYVNDTICEITGYSENQLTNSSIERLYSSEFTDNMLQYIHKSESNSPTKSILETQDGKHIHVKQYISRYSGADIISDYYYIIRIEDLTEDMINNQVIDVLNRILRHNLRTDISVIQGYTNTIKSENSENEKELESILKRTNSMEDISDKMKRVRDIIKEENQTVPISVEKLQSVINNYSKDIIKVNFDSNCPKSDCYIKSGSIISMISKDIINMVRDAADKATTIRVSFDEKDKRIKISYNSEVKFVDLDDWKVVRSGEEDPLNHNIGVDLWVIQWGVTLAGGSIEIEEYDQEEQSIKITFPKVI